MIISASRRTDIPNYYSDWFIKRMEEGFVYVRNPMNPHQISKVSLKKELVDCIVFWTKNPKNMIPKLKKLKDYPFYFQFTLTGYGKDVEPNLPSKREELISTFIGLSKLIGREKVILRYDPIFINETYTVDYHKKAFGEITEKLSPYTEKVIFSFMDFYTKTLRNTKHLNIRELTINDMKEIAKSFSEIAQRNHLAIETCAEKIELNEFQIGHAKCIDDKLIQRILGCKLDIRKDGNQRLECGCVESIDIGAYDTCNNGCCYCYANVNDLKVKENNQIYDINSPQLCSNVNEGDQVFERKVKSFRVEQLSLFDKI